jgi:hypothetical protein
MFPHNSKCARKIKWKACRKRQSLYAKLLRDKSTWRHLVSSQSCLAFLRDFIAQAEGREPQQVQDEYEGAAAREQRAWLEAMQNAQGHNYQNAGGRLWPF